MEDKIFDIEFKVDGKEYKGWVNPSEKLNDAGIPVSFHVVLNETAFGYLSFQNCKWMINEDRPPSLVNEVGKQIEAHYQI